MQSGDRVQVMRTYHWANGATGTVTSDGRTVRADKGRVVFYKVSFDEPQFDAEGDGPYQVAEIDVDALMLLT